MYVGYIGFTVGKQNLISLYHFLFFFNHKVVGHDVGIYHKVD